MFLCGVVSNLAIRIQLNSGWFATKKAMLLKYIDLYFFMSFIFHKKLQCSKGPHGFQMGNCWFYMIIRLYMLKCTSLRACLRVNFEKIWRHINDYNDYKNLVEVIGILHPQPSSCSSEDIKWPWQSVGEKRYLNTGKKTFRPKMSYVKQMSTFPHGLLLSVKAK